jgi:hypothetical protein
MLYLDFQDYRYLTMPPRNVSFLPLLTTFDTTIPRDPLGIIGRPLLKSTCKIRYVGHSHALIAILEEPTRMWSFSQVELPRYHTLPVREQFRGSVAIPVLRLRSGPSQRTRIQRPPQRTVHIHRKKRSRFTGWDYRVNPTNESLLRLVAHSPSDVRHRHPAMQRNRKVDPCQQLGSGTTTLRARARLPFLGREEVGLEKRRSLSLRG